jgi:pyruvate dehydrogenase E1 component
VDFSTGSLGLGPAAPLFAALTRRYVDDHFGAREPSRFIALMGDAELDEGNVWEAVAEPASAGLGNVLWIVDFNRQSLDRVVPVLRARQREALFASAGWHVREVRYGRKLLAKFAGPGGEALRAWLDALHNEEYRVLSHLAENRLRSHIRETAPGPLAADIELALADVPDTDLAPLLQDFGGHDIAALLEAYAECDAVTDRPSVVFAYTVKGWGLPTAWHPGNHYTLLTKPQIDLLRASQGLAPDHEWDGFPDDSQAGLWCRIRAEQLRRPQPEPRLQVRVPVQVGARRWDDAVGPARRLSSQAGFGRLLAGLAQDPEVAPFIVTVAPDVATGTSLSGFIERVGSYHPAGQRDWNDTDAALRWRQTARGQHVELGISEMNLFLLLGQLGLSWDLSAQPLLPIGTVYDPFLCRGLDGFIYATYSGARFVVAGTPSGISLAPEGGEHQSTITASIGLELPGVTYCEPAYVGALDWLLCDAVGRIARAEEDAAFYFRLSNRPIDQRPFDEARERYGDDELRRLVLAGAYKLVDAGKGNGPCVYLVGCGPVLPELLAAATRIAEQGIAAHVVDITSPDRLYAAWRSPLRDAVRAVTGRRRSSLLDELFAVRAPLVTVHDSSSHTLAWLGAALGLPAVPLGVDAFGQSGSVHELYEEHDLLPESIVNAAMAAVALSGEEKG